MKISKNKNSGKTVINTALNQTITYDPTTDSYMIQTECNTPVGMQIHTTTVSSAILDQMYNISWHEADLY